MDATSAQPVHTTAINCRSLVEFPMSLVYFDITIGGTPTGRMVFRLYDSVAPRTTQNFKSLCVGDQGIGRTTGKKLSYENTIFHRVIPGFMCQGGDFSRKDGTGGESIYGGKFADELFRVKHTKPGLLPMANAGPNTNGSQFFITFASTPHLDGKHIVFGELLEGMDVLRKIEKVETGDKDRPTFGQEVVIEACGALGEKQEPPKESASAKRALEQYEEDLGLPDKRHKKEKKDKKEKKSKKSKKTKKSKAKKSKKRRHDSSSSSSDSSSDDSSVSNRRPEQESGVGSETVQPHAELRAAVTSIVEKDDAQDESAEIPEPAPEKPVRVDADGVVCRGRGNFKYRDEGEQRGGWDRNRSGGGDRRAPLSRDRAKYVPMERSYDGRRDRDRSRSRSRSPGRAGRANTRGGDRNSSGEDRQTGVKDRLSRALGSERNAAARDTQERSRRRSPSPSPERRGRSRSDVSDRSHGSR
jgi:peptidyl-prolyl isomerase G (cyclophilin G)